MRLGATILLLLASCTWLISQTCPATITGPSQTFSSDCTGDITIISVNNNATITISGNITGNVIISDQQLDFILAPSGSISGNLIVNNQQVDLFINGNIGGDLDINSQQVSLQLAADIGGTLDLGQQQVDVDVVGNATVGFIVSQGQQNDFIVDNGDDSDKITLTVLNDFTVGDQQNTIQTSVDDEVVIYGAVTCTGTGCNQFDFVGNISAGECNAESGNFCSDADLDVIPTLPVELLYFNAKAETAITLSWATATEINNDFFSIERSEDGVNFYEIGRVSGHGNSNEELTYEFTDKFVLAPAEYYRLKQVDFDGAFEYFHVIRVSTKLEKERVEIRAYPTNVQNGELSLSSSQPFQVQQITIFNLTGGESKNLKERVIQENQLKYKVDLNGLQKGFYLLRMTSSEGLEFTTRLIVK